MPENWKPITGYEGLYDISDQGRVRSLRRSKWRQQYELFDEQFNQRPEPLYTKGFFVKTANAYFVNLRDQYGINENARLGRLVVEHFIPITGMQRLIVKHLNGDISDNRLSNLVVVPRAGRDTGTPENRFNAKLTEEKVKTIRKIMRTTSVKDGELAKQYGMSYSAMNSIRRNITWKDVR